MRNLRGIQDRLQIIDNDYYVIGRNNPNGLVLYTEKTVLEHLANDSISGEETWIFSPHEDFYYGMSWSKYQPLQNYLEKVIEKGMNLVADGKDGPFSTKLFNFINGEDPDKIIAINTGIRDKKNGNYIYALCIYRDYVVNDSYLINRTAFRNRLDSISDKMRDKNASFFMYECRSEKLPTEVDSNNLIPVDFYDGKLYKMAVKSNLETSSSNSIIGDMDHLYEHIDRLPPELRPQSIDCDFIYEVNRHLLDIDDNQRLRPEEKKKRKKVVCIDCYKNQTPQDQREHFELKMKDVISDAIDRVKRNPRLAIPYGLNKSNLQRDCSIDNDIAFLAQFVIPIFSDRKDNKPCAGLTILCKCNRTRVTNRANLYKEKNKKQEKAAKIRLDEITNIVEFNECFYSQDTILPLPIIRMNVLPYVDCDLSYLWCKP